jgi:lysophospholipase L1-like esterase
MNIFAFDTGRPKRTGRPMATFFVGMRWHPVPPRALVLALVLAAVAGCGGNDGGTLSNDNPGINDLNKVVAFGDSITKGSVCSCVPYPARLSGLIAKTVYNEGVGGSQAAENVSRTQTVIDTYHPAFMLILYGVNDIIHGDGYSLPTAALGQMVAICKNNDVVPVLATYPEPFGSHAVFASGTLALNDNIRALASSEGIKCVDLESEFMGANGPNPALYVDDGLHPNDAGTQIMAMAFADLF